MDLIEFRNHNNHGSRHPWELARSRFVISQLKKLQLVKPRVLDIGSGDAWLADQIWQALPSIESIVCCDSAYQDSDRRTLKSMRSTPLTFVTEIPKQKFDLILLCDVLEHIQEDGQFLKMLVEHHLSPNGFILITVPQWPGLYTQHDRILQHFRRYRLRQLQNLIDLSGLQTQKRGQIFLIPLLIRCLEKLREGNASAQQQIQGWRGGKIMTNFLTALLSVDCGLGVALGVLPGLSAWCICQKSS